MTGLHLAQVNVAGLAAPLDSIPTLSDAEERLSTLRAEGPAPSAFTLKEPYPIRRPAPAP